MTTFYKGPPVMLPIAMGVIAGAGIAPVIAEKTQGSISTATAFIAIFLICGASCWLVDRIQKNGRNGP